MHTFLTSDIFFVVFSWKDPRGLEMSAENDAYADADAGADANAMYIDLPPQGFLA